MIGLAVMVFVSHESEELVNALAESLGENEGEKRGRDVLSGFDGADGLPCDAGQIGQIGLR